MVDPTQEVLDGSVGFFWPQEATEVDLDEARMVRGFIRRSEEGLVEVRSLNESDEDHSFFGRPSTPLSVFGMTEATGVLLPSVSRTGWRRSFGGSRASVDSYSTSTLLTGVDLATVSSTNATQVGVLFGDGLSWAGLRVMEEERKAKSMTIRLDASGNKLDGGVVSGLSLSLHPQWAKRGHGAAHEISTSLEVRLQSKRPRPIRDFIAMQLAVQDLLSLSYDRFVPATGARASLHGSSDDNTGRAYLWDRDLMDTEGRLRGESEPVRPLFSLADIAGAAGLRRWLQLGSWAREPLAAVASVHRSPGGFHSARLLHVAYAIERYVNLCRQQGRQWAKKSQKTPSHAAALAARVGRPFDALVGDGRVWADSFIGTYNALKHDPSFTHDFRELRLFGWSGQVLLMCALLDRAAGSKVPSRKILADYRLQGGAEDIRAMLDLP